MSKNIPTFKVGQTVNRFYNGLHNEELLIGQVEVKAVVEVKEGSEFVEYVAFQSTQGDYLKFRPAAWFSAIPASADVDVASGN